ncbi:MAG: TOBE domain-containing protein [Bacteroidetes bacterium]|nr:TOBE domain-containing protein [Bacteroidota bacterium]
MNTLQGKITAVKTHGNLSLVNILVGEVRISSIIIETPDSVGYLREGHDINVLFKETEVIISIDDEPRVSLRNRFPSTILRINKGVLLSELTLQTEGTEISSIITTNAVEQLDLKEGDKVLALIKTNEIMLSE